MFTRKLHLMLLSVIVGLLLAGCTPAPASNPSGPAEKATSGEITVYTALEDDQISKYLPFFNQKYPDIKVNIVRDSTGIVTAKLLAEKANPQADVVWGLAATSLLVADKEGMLAPYAPEGVDKIRANFRDSQNPPHWVGIDSWFSAFCVNTAELAAKNLAMPTSWDDLLKPEYKGLIVMPNPSSSGTGYLSVSAILQLKGEEEGWKYLDKLNDNMAIYTHSGSKPCKMAGAGETVIGISFDYRAIKQMADGQPIEAIFPREGSGWETEANALVKKATINPAARTFLDWAISPEIMKEYAQSYPITAADTGVAIPAGYPADPLKQLIKNDLVKAAAERERILQEWMKRYDAKSEPK
jgi:iron(III) transport system substrate-binding protein